ncbi:MAG: glycoside hydrolase family 2 protein, partial [Bacteroidaceae bacterium]
NPTDKIAFFVRLALKDRSGNLIFPIFWDDNYITILPGETKTISAILPEIRDKRMNLEINGWNVQRRIIKIDS